MAFWLVTVIQPYCDAFASGATTVATADNQPESDGHPHEVPHCPELTALGLQLLTDTPRRIVRSRHRLHCAFIKRGGDPSLP